MTAPYVDFRKLIVGERLPPLPFSVSSEEVQAFLEATGEPMRRWDGFVPPHCLYAQAMAEATRVMPLPAWTVHVGTELAMQALASCADSFVAQFGLARRRESNGSLLSHFDIAIATGRGAPTLAGSITLVSQDRDGNG